MSIVGTVVSIERVVSLGKLSVSIVGTVLSDVNREMVSLGRSIVRAL